MHSAAGAFASRSHNRWLLMKVNTVQLSMVQRTPSRGHQLREELLRQVKIVNTYLTFCFSSRSRKPFSPRSYAKCLHSCRYARSCSQDFQHLWETSPVANALTTLKLTKQGAESRETLDCLRGVPEDVSSSCRGQDRRPLHLIKFRCWKSCY
jgi:hypothetical protein